MITETRQERTKTLMAGLRNQSTEEFTMKEVVSRFLVKAAPRERLFPVTSIVTGQDPLSLLHESEGVSGRGICNKGGSGGGLGKAQNNACF